MQRTARVAYDVDFALWAESQAAALREGRFGDVDIANVTEELESLARGDRRELRSRLTTLMLHLPKLEYQPDRATPTWRGTIVEQATKILELLAESPSLQTSLAEAQVNAYFNARRQAAVKTEFAVCDISKKADGPFFRHARYDTRRARLSLATRLT